jgi:hypothetical protein
LAVKKIAGCLIFVMAVVGVCFADAGSQPVNENEQLKARIDKLEKELAELKQIVKQQEEARIKAETAAAAKPEPNKVMVIEKPAAPAAGVAEKKPVVSGLDVQIYGRLKADAIFDTARVDPGNYAKWVRPDRGNNDHSQFDLTANETRLGMWIYGPKGEEIKTGGRVEIDFYGGGAENKPNPMMRHAYMTVEWPQDKFGILAGQTSDVISPLYPDTLNYTVGWWVGNIGYRRPQVRLTKSWTLDKDTELKLESALARTLGRTNTGVLPADDRTDSGENSGIPTFQGRVSMTFPSWGYKPTTIGFSGHYGKEEYDTNTAGGVVNGSKRFDSWSLNVDVLQPVNEWLSFKGEIYWGQDLDAYLGGIGQGVNTVRSKEIRDKGGWVEASLGPWGKWNFNVGVTADDADGDDLAGMSGDKRTYNQSIFGNVLYDIDKNAQIGFELSHWRTDYIGEEDAHSLRAQTSFIYKF